jgi:hypothetical protein
VLLKKGNRINRMHLQESRNVTNRKQASAVLRSSHAELFSAERVIAKDECSKAVIGDPTSMSP